MKRILILRPSPGAEETAVRAAEAGFDVVTAPLFTVHAVAWANPGADRFDAVMLTSANAPRHAGSGLDAFHELPCYAVGEATAGEARRHGFAEVRTGNADGAALAGMMVRDGIRRAFHPCGRDHVPLEMPGLSLIDCVVYAAEAARRLPDDAHEALGAGAVALVHSPRAGALFARLVDDAGLERDAIPIAAISPAAAEAAGSGWKATLAALTPRDDALLELAAKLCKTDAMGPRG
jgi:uroporphyrinogen-III synthase